MKPKQTKKSKNLLLLFFCFLEKNEKKLQLTSYIPLGICWGKNSIKYKNEKGKLKQAEIFFLVK